MKYAYLLVAIAAGVSAPVAAQDASSSATYLCAPVSEDAVIAQFARFNAAWATLDPDGVTALFGENASLLPTVSGRMRTDSASIRDYFVGFLRSKPVGAITESEVTLGCNIATRSGNWTVRLTNPETNVATDVSARFTFIYTYENGDWKIHHLHSSMRPAS